MTTFVSKSLARKREMLENNEKGFTLIELLVVVLIIGVLAAIAIPIYLTTQETAKENSVKSSVVEAKTALVAYYTETGNFTTDITDLTGFGDVGDIVLTIDPASTGVDSFCIEGYYQAATSHPFHVTDGAGAQANLCP